MNKVLVIGCAKSGYWVARLLLDNGYKVIITDKNAILEKAELENLGVDVYDRGHPDSLKRTDYTFVVKNPGIPYTTDFVEYFVNNNVQIYTEIEIATRYACDFTFAAITGTNGKTTTTTLLYEILASKTNAFASGNIGTALSETVYKHGNEKANVALEISAFQLLGSPSFRPLVSCITNLTPDHLDYFKTLDEYYLAKCLVYKNQKDDDWFIKNIDDENVVKYCKDVRCKVITMSLYKDADLMISNKWVTLFNIPLFKIEDLKIVGMHNVQNSMVASCMAYKMGIKPEVIREVIRNFKGIEHRIEFVANINGVDYYNDSKGTNVDSTIMALRAFDRPVILLAGGHDKHTGFKELEAYQNKMKKLIVFGETKQELSKLKKDAVIVENMKDATEVAYQIAEEGDIVLLSPACSSYDQFKNFEERGEMFKEYVLTLGL